MARGLHVSLSRGAGVPDPIVNGYTRLARGAVANLRSYPPLTTGPGSNQLQRPVVTNAAGAFNLDAARQASAPNDPRHTLIGMQLGSARLYMGESGANGGPELWTAALIQGSQLITDSVSFKLAISPAGRLRAWVNGGALFDGTPGDAIAGNGSIWQSSDNNPSNNQGTGFYSRIVACAENALRFASCPPLGTVVVTIGAEAPIVVNLDAAGAGALDVGGRAFPLAVGYVIKDAGAAVVAALFIPAAYGGDVVGHR